MGSEWCSRGSRVLAGRDQWRLGMEASPEGLCASAIASRHGLEVQVPVRYTPANEPWELWKDPERGTPIKDLVL